VQVRDLGLPVLAILGGPVQVQAVADRAVRAYGQLDTWVHMAGVLLVAGFDDTTPEEFARVLQVNLLGQVHGAKAALPHLRREGGAFISMSSMGSQRGIPLQSAYCSGSPRWTLSGREAVPARSVTPTSRSSSRRPPPDPAPWVPRSRTGACENSPTTCAPTATTDASLSGANAYA
jgi:hypothetical protein